MASAGGDDGSSSGGGGGNPWLDGRDREDGHR